MEEALLQFIWKYQKFNNTRLSLTDGTTLTVLDPGVQNELSGPDFHNARLLIDDQLWAGNLEVHTKSSLWFSHGHHQNPQYNNIILHVVWIHDREVFDSVGRNLPTLELAPYLPEEQLQSFRDFLRRSNSKFINCERHMTYYPSGKMAKWFSVLFHQRLYDKEAWVTRLFKETINDIERVFFISLLTAFGQNLNTKAFFDLARSIDYRLVRKVRSDRLLLTSLLFGMAGFLTKPKGLDINTPDLVQVFDYLKRKYQLTETNPPVFEFRRTRPANFPTRRLAQFSEIFSSRTNMLSRTKEALTLSDLYQIFQPKTHSGIDDRKKSSDKLSKTLQNSLLINGVIPFRLAYDQMKGKNSRDLAINWYKDLHTEQNAVLAKFRSLGVQSINAFESQALLQLYRKYCTVNRCLECQVGIYILGER